MGNTSIKIVLLDVTPYSLVDTSIFSVSQDVSAPIFKVGRWDIYNMLPSPHPLLLGNGKTT
jgi:hypothetical protein